MKKFIMLAIATMMAVGFTSCSASDDEILSGNSTVAASEFALINYTKSESTPVAQDGTKNSDMNEKLVCKVLPGGKLMLTHKNVIFDDGTDIKISTALVGNKLIVTETGDYGKSGNYGYYTLTATVGTMKDGNYVIVVKRNDHVREEFNMTYDSSKAK